MRETESLRAAQQMLCNNAIHQLTNAMYTFRSVRHIDGHSEKERSILAEDLMTIEDALHSVQSQIETIRNLYLEV
ncbi:hypothetical protein [Enterococcus casseliflavus]|uniref:hypothetical protein n=1 Tax=Enterococcus casseliflavus TaxID=37734 RepID=UPI000E4D6240|nr:hypothetical protein [Enterococcus casseliflavus]RHH53634.1 hypothetical protein DW201_14405 [Enterococcus casseliflavus]